MNYALLISIIGSKQINGKPKYKNKKQTYYVTIYINESGQPYIAWNMPPFPFFRTFPFYVNLLQNQNKISKALN